MAQTKMKDLLVDCNLIATKELERANELFPLFHSDHEGMAIINEEVFEVDNEWEPAKEAFIGFREAVFRDDSGLASSELERLREHSLYCVAELMQVIAMCDKFVLSGIKRGVNE